MSGVASRRRAVSAGWLALLLSSAAAVACGHRPTGARDGVTGFPADARVQDGAHDGWIVKRDCDVSDSVTVIGTGDHWSNDVAPGSSDTDRGKALEDFQRLL